MITDPVNDTQREFNRLCNLGGGTRGGPAIGKVADLLAASGNRLNAWGYEIMEEHIEAHPEAYQWHICFAVGLSWGHLAKLDVEFTSHVVAVLSDWNSSDLSAAMSFYLERGPEPIEQSLIGAHNLFSKVTLPKGLPNTLEALNDAQQRWLSPILNPSSRPRYIGSWNATAMFMTALFAQPKLAASQRIQRPMLPPGGPIYNGLRVLHKVGVLTTRPAGSELDDEAFEPGALYENNQLLVDLLKYRDNWCLVDVHSGVYMLGTRDRRSGTWR